MKDNKLLKEMNELTVFHKHSCKPYSDILKLFWPLPGPYDTLEKVPYFPADLFKYEKLMSIPEEKLFKILYSSGTSSGMPSKIYLDAETAQRQTRALAEVMIGYLGKERLPMLILDAPNVIKDPKNYSARGAGIVGMLTFGKDHHYVYDESMQIDKQKLRHWLQKHKDEKILLFGFTYIAWQFFLALEKLEFDLSNSIFIHSGGWKKMIQAAVTPSTFKTKIKEIIGITRIYNFYGLVEQIGAIFMECEHGFFHCPAFADIIIRDPIQWSSSPAKKEGVIQVMSALPKSYPGHSLLTGDLGVLHGVDDCACGRTGKYFTVTGRIPKTELRGCSDTFQ